MIILFLWLLLGALGAVAIGFCAWHMRQLWRESRFMPSLTRWMAAVALQHVVFVYLAWRGIENYSGGDVSFSVLLLTAAQLLVTPLGVWHATTLLGWIGRPREER